MGTPQLTIADLNKAFGAAMTKIKGFTSSHDLNCSTDVQFDGLSNNDKFAVEMWFDGRTGRFHLTFSKHYLGNRRDKVEKMFFRYIATANLDGTFKNYTQVKDELRKLPFETHYDVTYQNDYLVTDISTPFNGVVCDKCHRAFRYDPGAKIFKHISRFMCVCGGSLTAIIDGVKQVSANSVERYLNCDPRQLDALRNVDLTPLKAFSQEVQDEVRRAISAAGKLNTKTLRPLITSAVTANNAELLRALDATFPSLYTHLFRKLSAELKRRVCALAVPAGVKQTVEVATLSGDAWAGTVWADDGPLLAAVTAAFFGEDTDALRTAESAPTADAVQIDIVVDNRLTPYIEPWDPSLARQVAAIFFNEKFVQVAAGNDSAHITDAHVDWNAVTDVFFDNTLAVPEPMQASPAPLDAAGDVEPAEPMSAAEPTPLTTFPDDGVDWPAVRTVFFDAADTEPAPEPESTPEPEPVSEPEPVQTSEPESESVDWARVQTVFFDQPSPPPAYAAPARPRPQPAQASCTAVATAVVEVDWSAVADVFFERVG